MSSHHNDSARQPQYDGNNSNGFVNFSVHGLHNSNSTSIEEIQSSGHASVNGSASLKPVWDRERRELRIGQKVVKRFRWPAENQERVLDAFEDNGWPSHIADPLEKHPKICQKRRLHDTIKCLNRKQLHEVIKFRGDGTGLGVLLEIVRDNE